ncbi:MAG: J domain-containing protein [Nanoarchaeota archaeon]
MTILKIKGHEIAAPNLRDSFGRRALQCKNKIIAALKKLGITEEDIDIDLENAAAKRAPASASWYFESRYMHYSYKSASKYVENLYVVFKVIELEVDALISGQKSLQDFMHEFSEDKEVNEHRKEARKILGVDENELNLSVIDLKYKELAKNHHPDMPEGDVDKFKQINHAHKILKRELQ